MVSVSPAHLAAHPRFHPRPRPARTVPRHQGPIFGVDGNGPDPHFPQSPAFYYRVLEYSPAPTIVLDAEGRIVYANAAARDLGGWSPEEGVGMSTLDQVHPDDLEQVVRIFAQVATATDARQLIQSEPWGAIHFRMLDKHHRAVPLEVTGTGGLRDPEVRGIIYDLRPAWNEEPMHQILTGLAGGATTDEVFRLILETVTVPPLEVDVALADCTDPAHHRVVVARGERFAAMLARGHDPLPGRPR